MVLVRERTLCGPDGAGARRVGDGITGPLIVVVREDKEGNAPAAFLVSSIWRRRSASSLVSVESIVSPSWVRSEVLCGTVKRPSEEPQCGQVWYGLLRSQSMRPQDVHSDMYGDKACSLAVCFFVFVF